MSITVKVTVNPAKLTRLMQRMPKRADEISGAAALDMVGYLRNHWSPVVPSSPGEPPALRSGALGGSIRLSKLDNGRYRVSVGASYAKYLEGGTRRMKARPFWAPAIYVAQHTFRQRFDQFLKDGDHA